MSDYLYSFDVFDTVITRKTATPHGIFAIMQEKLLCKVQFQGINNYIRRNFFQLRINSERLARTHYCVNGVQDVTLEQIYKAMGITGNLAEKEAELLIQLEKDTELDHVVGIRENIEKIKELWNQKEHVIFISDMYLDKATIRNMLIKVDPLLGEIPIYVSSEYQKNKRSGYLFQVIKELEKVEYENWIHFGDDEHSDFLVPLRLGIHAQRYPYEKLTQLEQKEISKNGNNSFYQYTIGAARNTRLFEKLSGEAAIGATVSGVILFPYVEWLLEESRKKQIKRLYFIARDGYILRKMADIIIRERGYDISTYYIYGSRRAWRMASICEENCDIRTLLRWSHERKIINITQLADVFELTVKELEAFLPKDFCKDGFALTPQQRDYCKEMLARNPQFSAFLMEKHGDKRARAIQYLKQEVDHSDDRFAFVELAGSGYTQECLARIMKEFYRNPIVTFYFKLDRVQHSSCCINRAFFPSLLDMHIMIEMICRAPHGQTWGYEEKEGRIVPVISREEGKAFQEKGYEEYIEGILLFTQNYTRVTRESGSDIMSLDLLLDYHHGITKDPDNEILDFFADMPNNETGREKGNVEFAPVLSRKQLRLLYLYRTVEPIEKFYPGTYLEYSLLRCSRQDRRRIAFYKKHHDKWLGKLYRLPKKLIRKHGLTKGYAAFYSGKMWKGKIALYAAGKAGQATAVRIQKSKAANLVLWVDKDYGKYREMGLPVDSPEKLGEAEYDMLIIAVRNGSLAADISEELMGMGVPIGKVVWVFR